MVRNLAELGPNLRKIMQRLCANENLVRLLYYTDKEPLTHPSLTTDEVTHKIFDKLVKITPKVDKEDTAASVIVIKIDKGLLNAANAEIKTIIFDIEIFVPITQWFIKGEQLRPFSIMGEIENSLKGKNINGLGKVSGGEFMLNFLTEEISAYKMTFMIEEYD